MQTLLHDGRLVRVAVASLAFTVTLALWCRGVALLGSRGKRWEMGLRKMKRSENGRRKLLLSRESEDAGEL